MSSWLIFGGWAVAPEILKPLFGENARYIDSNLVAEALLENGALAFDWLERAYHHIQDRIPPDHTVHLAGWSMGAILAAALCGRVQPRAFISLAGTPSFCRRESFRHGTRPSVLAAMRNSLMTERDATLRRFYKEAGIEERELPGYSPDRLCAGLCFLEHASLLPVTPLPCPALYLHGERDTIIPVAAGAFLAEAAKGTLRIYPGGHAFFEKNGELIRKVIERMDGNGVDGG
jgi:pimeloyl-ACP methyl ester carboxylesterase